MSLSKLIAIVGPTASGKSALAIKLAQKCNGEIVSADSRQIYKGMDIGTAKVNGKWNKQRRTGIFVYKGIPHCLVDIKNPNEDYSVGEYKKDAIKAIDGIITRGKTPILVGGTGLYISAIVDNWEMPEIKANEKLRAKLEREIAKNGLEFVFKKLIAIDPEAVYIVDPKNPRRIIRALEIALLSGKKFSEQRKKGKPLYDTLVIGLSMPDEILKKRISKRIKEMANDGLVNEVKKLIKKYGTNCKAFDAIGYREIISYLKKEKTLEEALTEMDTNTVKYAKRQMTWFSAKGGSASDGKKFQQTTKWVEDYREAEKIVKGFL